MHALRLGGREQPAGDHSAPFGELDPARGGPGIASDPRAVAKGPRSWTGGLEGGRIGGGGGIGNEPTIGEGDPAVGESHLAIEVEPADGHNLFARLEPNQVAPRQTGGPAGRVPGG